MANKDAFNNNTPNNDGVFGNSLIDDATLVKPLTDSPSPLGITQSKDKNSGNYDPFAPLNDDTKSSDSKTDQTAVVKALEQPSVFTQPNLLPVTQSTSTNNKNTDKLTGNKQNTPLLGATETDPLTGNPKSALFAANSITPPIPNFAIRTESTVRFNGGGDLDGNPLDKDDDALIYAAKGFTINGNITLPVQRNASGNPILDASGKPILINNAVAVSSGYTVANGPSNQYAGLIPPPVIPLQTINVPAYTDLKQQELNRRIAVGTPTVTFNISQNPIKNANDWNAKFPSAGTQSNPTAVRVIGGGLEIPNGVTINNYVITVDSGDITFKGNNHTLNNVMLVANNGSIDMARAQTLDIAVFASNSITMAGNARFEGVTTIANGSNSGSITFNGASKNLNSSNKMQVVSQGSITWSGASDTRGTFISAGDFTFNGNSTLYGSINAKGNITFNGQATVTYAADTAPDFIAPVIAASLEKDTARNNTTNTDKITSDPTIIGSVTDTSSIAEFKAGFNSNNTANFTNVLAQRNADGSFRLTRSQLEQIYGGTLPDGTHTLKLQAKDASGNTTSVYEFTFTLDTTEPAPSNLDLTATTDSGRSDTDNITNNTAPAITGNANAGALVQLSNSGQVIGSSTADSTGKWQITSSTLTNGTYNLTATATDIAGNVSAASQPLSITIDTVAPISPTLKLTAATDTGISNSDGITKNNTPIIAGTAEANSTVKLYKDGQLVGTTNASVNGEWQVQLGTLANSNHVFTATSTDTAGNISAPSTQYTVTVDTQINPPSNLDLATPSDSGISNVDNITKVTTPIITGNADANTTVQLFNAGQIVGQATTGSDGKWQITTNNLANGTYNLSAQATDIAGNVSTSSPPLQVIIDSALPQITLTTPINTQPLQQNAKLTGNVDGTGSSIIALQYRFDNNAEIALPFSFTGVFDSNIDFTGISNGSHTLSIIATDTAGNIKTTQYNVTVALDQNAPVIAASLQRDTATFGVTNTDKITFDPTITGTVIDASNVVEFKAGFNNAIAANFVNVLPYRNSNGSFTFDRTLLNTIYSASINGGTSAAVLPDGQHTLKLVAKDNYGNVSGNYEFTFTLDTTTPTPILSLVVSSDTGISQSDRITNDLTPTITGNGEFGASVQLFNGTQVVGQTTVGTSGIWQITTSELTDGVKSLSAIASDIAGNTSTSTPIGITIDTLLPQLTLTTPIESSPLQPGAKLTGNINGTGSPLTAFSYRFNLGTEIPVNFNAAGTFDQNLDFTGLGNGNHTLTITAIDTAGNILTNQYNVTINLDIAAPVIMAALVRDTAANGATNLDKITFDPSIIGSVVDASQVAEFKAGFDNTPVANFINVLPQRNTDGTFSLTRTQLETIYSAGVNSGNGTNGGTLPDGVRTLKLIAKDEFGNQSDVYSFSFTLDTVTPTPSNLDLPASKDTGVSNADNITKNASPTITGNAEIGATVKLINNADGLLIGLSTVSASGIWQIDVNNLVNGIYNLSAIASDIAGNVSTPSTPFTITIDSVAPTLTLTTPIDTTPLNQGARFVGSANGTGSAIASISYRFNSGTEVPLIVSSNGTNAAFNQQLDLTGLPNGNHILTVTTTDVAGNIFTKQYNVTVNIDTEAPIITVSLVRDTAPGNATNSDRITNNPAITGTVSDANRVVELKAGLNNTAINSFVDITAQIQPNGSFTLDNSALAAIYNATNSGNSSNNLIPDGTYTLRLVAKDEFGNTSPTKEYTFTLDTTTPAPTNLDLPASIDSGVSATDNITNFNTPTITGNAEANSTVQLFNNGNVVGEATTNADGIWQIVTSDLTDGTYNLNAQATDIAGNVSSISTPIQLIIDRTLPQLNLTTPIDNAPLTTGAKLIGNVDGTGSGIASLSYRFDNSSEVSVTLDNANNFNQQLDLTALTSGSHVLTLVATDIAGNVKTISYNVTINNDTIAPLITAGLKNDTAPSGTINSNPNDEKLSDTPSESLRDRITYDPSITGFVTDTSSIASFKAGFNNQTAANFVDVFAQLNTDGSFNFNRTTLEAIYGGRIPDGAHTLRLIASDSYGNTSNAFSFTFTLDTNIAQPTFNLDAASDSGTIGDNKTKFNTVTLTGLTEPGAILILEQTGANGATSPVLGQNGTPLTVTADNTGKYNFTNVSLAAGNNTFTVRATDIAGNTSSFSTIIYRFSAPTAINLTHNTVAENSAVGTVIGELSSIDPDSGDTHTYTLIDNAGGRFQIVDNKLQVANGTLLDFETNTQHTVIIRSTDKNGLILDKTQAIAITNVNEVPIFTSTPNNTTVESGSTFTYNITTTDPDAGDIRTLNAVGLPTWLTFTDNGNGTATITGTPNQNQLGLFNIAITATDAGGLKATQNIIIGSQITLSEQTNFSPKRNFGLTIPVTPSILTFKIDPSFDLSDTKFINDAFEVALVDANGISLVHAIGKGRDAFFNLTEGEPVGNGAGATYNPTTKTVSLNLVGVKPGEAQLIFRLVNDDKDTATSVRITDFALVAAPAGTVAATQTQFATEIRPNAAPNFNTLVDVSNSLAAQYQRSSFNADTKTLYADIAVRNIGSYSVDVPVLVAVKNISDPSVILRNPDGVTPDGIPYYDFTSLVASGKLNPQGESGSRSLAFYNPNGVQFTYDVVVLAQLNVKPVIESKPVVEVIGGQEYRYDVNATDPNGDSVTYKLLTSPEGMTIEENTGLITWNTLSSNKGNQSIVVEVSDGRGGVTLQNYILSVIDTPPNRPPIFTTTPIVDAYINKLYKYDADAVDPDGDYPLSYSLIVGPNGMTVNPSTGVVEWTPPPVLVLGDTVLGLFGIPGENDEFTFSGTKGQRIYFDPLQYSGDYYNWRFDVYSPSNIKVINGADFRWDNNQLLTLTEDGNYRIVVDAQGDYVGNYGFSVIDSNLVPVVPFDTVIKGSLSPGSEDDVFRFTGNKGQKLYFDELSKDGSLDWVVYNASNQVVASNDNFDDMEVDLLADGQYILALRGKSAFSSTVDYSFTIVTPDIITKPLTLGSNDNPHIVSGAISEKGEQDIYIFTGTAGQQLFYDALGGDYFTLTLYDPTNNIIYSADNRYDRGPDNNLTLGMSGTYKVVIDGNGSDIGSYKFQFLDKAAAPEKNLDTDIIGQFKNDSIESHLYRFNIPNGGKYVYIDGQVGGGNSWLLYEPNGQYVTGNSINNDWRGTLKQGEYLLVMQGNGSSDPNYNVRVVTPETPQPQVIISGETVDKTITKKGSYYTYTFAGEAGQQLFYDALGGDYFTLHLIDPAGREIYSTDNRYDRGPDYSLTLGMSGTYKVVIDGDDDVIGSYKFRFLNKADAQLKALDTDIIGTIDNDGIGSTLYRFNIPSGGKYVYIDGQTGGGNTWLLYEPNGQYVTSNSINSDRRLTLKEGEYLLVMQGNGSSDPNYNVRVVTPETPQPQVIISGETVDKTITKKGSYHTYTFAGEAGQQLFYDALGGDYFTLHLIDPTGQEIYSTDNRYDRGPDYNLTLGMSGTYKVVIDGGDDVTGSYKFRFLNKADAQLKALDTDIVGTIDNGGIGSTLYRFNIPSGSRKKVNLGGTVGSSPNNWILYKSNGQLVSYASINDNQDLTLDQGEYLLVMQGNGGSDPNYQVQIKTLETTSISPSTGTSISFGQEVSGSINTVDGSKTYTFTGEAGQQLFYDGLGGDQFAVRIYDPTGRNLFDGYYKDSRYDYDSNDGRLVLTTSGTYQVEVKTEGEGIGNYKFRLLNKADSLAKNLDTDIIGQFDNDNLGTTGYRITIPTGGKYVYIDGQ
ncbi:Ig-like domain-containing protein, partial [Plectonema radiosum NIES-515]